MYLIVFILMVDSVDMKQNQQGLFWPLSYFSISGFTENVLNVINFKCTLFSDWILFQQAVTF